MDRARPACRRAVRGRADDCAPRRGWIIAAGAVPSCSSSRCSSRADRATGAGAAGVAAAAIARAARHASRPRRRPAHRDRHRARARPRHGAGHGGGHGTRRGRPHRRQRARAARRRRARLDGESSFQVSVSGGTTSAAIRSDSKRRSDRSRTSTGGRSARRQPHSHDLITALAPRRAALRALLLPVLLAATLAAWRRTRRTASASRAAST